MTTLKKYNITGKEVGTVKIDKSFTEATANGQMVKDYIVVLRANARQWSANTKGRSEVKHTTKKPHKQKGTGRARQGSLVTAQFRGGGVVFGPKPKFNQNIRMNKKEKKAVIRFLIAEKINNNHLIVLEDTHLEEPKTKTIANFLKTTGLNKRVLFLGEGNYEQVVTNEKKCNVSVKCGKHNNFAKSLRNLKKTHFALAKNINGYDLMIAEDLIMTEIALNEIQEWLA
ncbi:MAG: 50S ribosomal protein L4 [Chlamydiae bacterium]|nr:50S ribosomal protein L4 [Chlamydiota bacterium]